MIKKMQLKDLFIGKTDAKNELIEGSKSEVDTFMGGFFMPDNIVLSDFLDGKRYYITGLKGTGKTALLRYIGISAEKQLGASTHFVLFKSDIMEEERSKLSRAAELINKEDSNVSQYKDYESPWLWFLFRVLVKYCKDNNVTVFKDNQEWNRLRKKIEATINVDEVSENLFPRIKQGKIEINTQYLTVGLDFSPSEKSKEDKAKVDFVKMVKDCEALFKQLIPAKHRLYLFLDELELSYGTSNKYKRDVELIRDLILAVYRFNTIARQNSYPVYCVVGIRKEVVAATMSSGKEINKPVSDFGISLRWQQGKGDVAEHPLIKIIHKRISTSETILLENERTPENEIWGKYFPAQINLIPAQEYILNKTWYRPRDIVRLLGIAQQQFPNETKFSQYVLESINKEYSTDSWTEQVEELQAKYTKDEIEGIKHILMNIKCPFSLNEIRKKAEEARQVYKNVDDLLNAYRIGDILCHLYDIGIIGNKGNISRYAFRGDAGLLIEQDMTIHSALWNILSVEPKEKKHT